MPLSSRSQIVGGGANLAPPLTIGAIPQIVDVGPPGALSNTILNQRVDGAVAYITAGGAVREGVAATETFRLSGGFITQGLGQDSVAIGRGANPSQTDSIAIGRGASQTLTGTGKIIIGAGATHVDTGNNGIVIGTAAVGRGSNVVIGNSSSVGNGAAGALVIGDGANASANGGTNALIAIGISASVGNGGTATISGIAIGDSSVSRGRSEVVIGHSASQSQASATLSNSVLIGVGAIANVAAGRNIIVGGNSTTTQADCIIIGAANAITGTRNIVLGSGLTTALTNTAWIGTPTTFIERLIIGAGDTAAAPFAVTTIRFTNGSGTNVSAGQAVIQAPLSTGNASVGSIAMSMALVVGASGTALQTAQTALIFEGVAANTIQIRSLSGGTFRIRPANGVFQIRNAAGSANVIETGADTLGFYNATPVARPTITGSRGGNAALASLLTQLATQGLIIDGSVA